MNPGTIRKTLAGLAVVAASIVTVAGPASAADKKVDIPAARVPKFSASSALKSTVRGSD